MQAPFSFKVKFYERRFFYFFVFTVVFVFLVASFLHVGEIENKTVKMIVFVSV